jgi:hypothetical protein
MVPLRHVLIIPRNTAPERLTKILNFIWVVLNTFFLKEIAASVGKVIMILLFHKVPAHLTTFALICRHKMELVKLSHIVHL